MTKTGTRAPRAAATLKATSLPLINTALFEAPVVLIREATVMQ